MLVYCGLVDFCVQRTCFFHARKEKKLCVTNIMSRSAISSWGPCGWTFLHTASYAYPDNPTTSDKENMFKFLYYFARVIPCSICRKDFTMYIDKTIPKLENSKVFESKSNLVRYLIDAHNYVNVKLGKREYTYYEVDEIYLYGPSRKMHILLLITIVVIVLIAGICLITFRKKNNRTLPFMISF